MRIGLCGGSGTGKTTLARELSKELGIPMVPEGVRELCEEWGMKGLSDLRGDDDKYRLFQIELINRKFSFESTHDSFVADRTYLDNLAYYMYWICRKFGNEQNEAYKKLCISNMSLYDAVFFCPLGVIPYEEDGFRTSNYLYNECMQSIIYGLVCIELPEFPFFVLNEADLGDRVATVKREMEWLKKNPFLGRLKSS